jgi:dodecin
MSVAKITEIKVTSTTSFDDAIKEGIARAKKTLKNVKSAWISDYEVIVDNDGKIAGYRVLMKVTFILEE